jgi:hypothetical protein
MVVTGAEVITATEEIPEPEAVETEVGPIVIVEGIAVTMAGFCGIHEAQIPVK